MFRYFFTKLAATACVMADQIDKWQGQNKGIGLPWLPSKYNL
jgi:hypothetical protein